MNLKRTISLCLLLLPSILSHTQSSSFIHVDQFGYFPTAEKVAVISDPQEGYNNNLSFSPSNQLEVRDAVTHNVVFTGSIYSFDNGATQDNSGDKGWWFDFSELSDAGSYYIFDTGNQESSAIFDINENPYFEVMKAAGRMFYYNRCNYPKKSPFAEDNWVDGVNFTKPLQDANCRYINDPMNVTLEKDLTGGWFDAGDYNKYVTFTEGTLHDLLYAFEENPAAFGDNWNLPESGNNIADLLDEIKWELDWLLKMTNPDGSVHNKMGSQNYSENTDSPPSANNDQRFYGPTCTSASISVAGTFAHAALVYQSIPDMQSFVASLTLNAESTFDYGLNAYLNNGLETDCDDGSIVAGDADWDGEKQYESLITAAVFLYELTGNESYHNFFKDHYASTQTMLNNFWGADVVVIQDALLRYMTLPNGEDNIQAAIRSSATTDVNNNWNGYFGWQENDLYRSFMPDWSYYWGSNRPKAGYGSLNLSMVKYGIGNDQTSLERKAAEHLHYFHGVNPLGMVMLSNMYDKGAEHCVNQLYHTWFYDGTVYDHALDSPLGPAPGFVTGGPNPYFSYTQLSPPSGQPILKSYLDFNLGFPEGSWEITEPAIYYQAAYIRFLAQYVNSQDIVNSIKETAKKDITIFPNPATTIIEFNPQADIFNFRLLNSNGQVVLQQTNYRKQFIEISSLSSGLYILEIKGKNDLIYSGKFFKK